MKGVLYYFSGTGNTKWVADKLKDIFYRYKIELDIKNIEDEKKADTRGYSFLVIGTPVYAEIEPKIVEDFISTVPKTDIPVRCIVYSTQGGKSCSAVKRISAELEKKGYRVVSEAMICMPNNYFFYFGKEPSEGTIETLLNDAEKKIEKMAMNFSNNKSGKLKTFPLRQGVGVFVGIAFRKTLPKLSKNITSTDKCIKCGLCLRNCPKNNITFESGHAIIHSNCIQCMRCIFICPENVVLYKGKKIRQTQKEILKHLDLK